MDHDPLAIAYFPMAGVNEEGQPFAERTLTHVVRTAQGTALVPQLRQCHLVREPQPAAHLAPESRRGRGGVTGPDELHHDGARRGRGRGAAPGHGGGSTG